MAEGSVEEEEDCHARASCYLGLSQAWATLLAAIRPTGFLLNPLYTTVLCIKYIVHCTWYTVHYTLYTEH